MHFATVPAPPLYPWATCVMQQACGSLRLLSFLSLVLSSAATKMNGSAYSPGQEIAIFSNSQQTWLPAHVIAVHRDGAITCKYHGLAKQKDIPLPLQTPLLVRPALTPGGAMGKPGAVCYLISRHLVAGPGLGLGLTLQWASQRVGRGHRAARFPTQVSQWACRGAVLCVFAVVHALLPSFLRHLALWGTCAPQAVPAPDSPWGQGGRVVTSRCLLPLSAPAETGGAMSKSAQRGC